MSERRIYNLAYGKRYIGSDKIERKSWVPVGRLFIEPDSDYGERLSLRLDAIPVDPQFTGLLTAFPYEPRQGSNGKNTCDNVDDIPF